MSESTGYICGHGSCFGDNNSQRWLRLSMNMVKCISKKFNEKFSYVIRFYLSVDLFHWKLIWGALFMYCSKLTLNNEKLWHNFIKIYIFNWNLAYLMGMISIKLQKSRFPGAVSIGCKIFLKNVQNG